MAIGQLYHHSGGVTIMQMGQATPDNYRRSRKMVRALHARTQDKAQRSLIAEMIGDCDYAIEWMETGRRPGSVRGVERPMRISSWDPDWIDRYASPNARYVIERDSSSRDLTADERFRIEEAMRDLTDRERQCFMLHVVDGMSYEDIGRELHLGRSTVQVYIERSREKIEYAKLTNLFLV
ncbi:sigma-70 family RNA polymerase sigma factor [Paenibacillus lycopersici]|uniref:Sigma-70 family RNA polymerase sigma factor n=1 Tax=Paenibacillus lycopersici TaxID=2704462 RepID=A0A6C0G0D7_9BACL|nr:sigma-70 family RNA polymerase sigma factor [Paenibacillus lycopersici]QHT60659.1 sigma-70 family RNA polymerase sigma factor [Paenibacillus lycopersici]